MNRVSIIFLIFSVHVCGAISCVQAQSGEPSLIGSINIEDQEEKTVDKYAASQDGARDYFSSYNEKLQQVSASGSGSMPTISDDVLNYMSGLYLHCSVNYGVCPYMLDAILEVDVVNSKTSGSIACPNMKRFWTAWVKNGLEERHNYLVRTSFITATSNFKTKDRPKYLKCDKTVTDIVAGTGSAASFFKQRYSSGSEYLDNAPKIVALISQVIEKEKIRNIFVRYGAAAPDSGESTGKSGKTNKRGRN